MNDSTCRTDGAAGRADRLPRRGRIDRLRMRAWRAPLLLLLLLLLLPTCRSSPSAPPEPLEIVTIGLPVAVRGEPYAEAVHGRGGDLAYEWEIIQGALPEGLELSVDDLGSDHAIISGVPDDVENAVFTLRLTSGDGQTATRQFTIAVLPEQAPLAIHTRLLPPALQGGPYDVQLRANGGDGQSYTWQLIGGSLPAGLTLTQGGRIHGTPSGDGISTFSIRVSSGAASTAMDFELRVVVPDPLRYRLTIFPVTAVPAAVQPHVEQAVARIELAITGNLPSVAIPTGFFQPSHCGGFGDMLNGTSTDDLLIVLNIVPIDGPGGVLGRAGPCGLRQASNLPFAGIVTLDVDDLTAIAGTETLTDIITHEIAHVLGFGSLWNTFGLISGAGTNNPRFTGPSAAAEYVALGGTGGSVPLESQGGEGTAESHWSKPVFHIELMTGFVEPVGVAQPMSRVTVASFQDLGYSVDLTAADAFTLTSAARAPHVAGAGHGAIGHDEIYTGPVLVLERDGTATILELR